MAVQEMTIAEVVEMVARAIRQAHTDEGAYEDLAFRTLYIAGDNGDRVSWQVVVPLADPQTFKFSSSGNQALANRVTVALFGKMPERISDDWQPKRK